MNESILNELNNRIVNCKNTKDPNLDLSGLKLKRIPKLDELLHLQSIDLSNNNITRIQGLKKFQELINLNLSNNLINKIEGLGESSKLSYLDISNNQIMKIEGLEKLAQLSVLNISDNQITEVERLEELVQLLDLDISMNGITKIKGLEKLDQLSNLNIFDNNITKIEGLEQLVQLSHLNISNNKIKKIEELERLNQLEDLDISNNEITKIEGLEELTQLSSLNISNNEITKIEGLEKLAQIQYINISNNEITKIEGLEQLDQLQYVGISNNEITKIEGFEQLDQLQYVDISNNEITKIEGFEQISKIIILDISNNQIMKIEGLEQLTQLSHLYIYNNRLTKIEGLKSLNQLNHLNLSKNKIYDIKNLEELHHLQHLDLSENELTKFDGLEKNLKIEHLNLSKNKIKEINKINNLKCINVLLLSFNEINKIELYEDLNNLQKLEADNNKIKNISFLTYTKNIINLNLSSNKILDIEQIKNLVELKKVEKIIINENPIWIDYGILLNNNFYENHINNIYNLWSEKDSYVEKELPCSVLLLGNHSAGKTTLLNRILRKKDNITSTHGLKIELENSLDSNFPSSVYYDFGGQDFYHGLYRLFLKKQAIKIVVVNPEYNLNQLRLENKNTVKINPKNTQDFSLEYWANQINYFESLNKIKNTQKDTILIQSHYSSEKFWNYALCFKNDKVFDFIAINLKDENSIEFNYLHRKLEFLIKQHSIKAKLSPQRIKLTNEILEILTSENEYANPISIYDLLTQKFPQGTNLEALKLHLEQLHFSGLIFYDKNLLDGQFVWLNPKALINTLHSKILSSELLRSSKKQGIIDSLTFRNLNIPKPTIELLKFYNIIFEHKFNKHNVNEIEYIIPNYLPLINDHDPLYALSTFGFNKTAFTLKFLNFIPMGMINHFICFFGKQPDYKIFWRDTIVFTLSEGFNSSKPYRIMIHLDFSNFEIKTHIQGDTSNYNKVCTYLFYCIMRFYWDLHAKDNCAATYFEFNSQFQKNDSNLYSSDKQIESENNVLRYNINDIPPLTSQEVNTSEYIQQRPRRPRGRPPKKSLPIWKEFFEPKSAFIPEDLYISFNSEDFVKYSELGMHEKNNPLIKSYTFLQSHEDHKVLNSETLIPVGPFSIFTEKEFIQVKKIFISYSRKDVEFKDDLSLFLKTTFETSGHEVWDCGELESGKWDEQIKSKLDQSDLVIFMLSIHFFTSNYILEKELIPILKAAEEGKKQIMCVVVKNFPWDSFAQLGRKAKLDNPNLTDTNQLETNISIAKSEITHYQFLPYIRKPISSTNSENIELLTPLNKLSPSEREDIYVDIVKRVAKTLGI